MSPSTTLRALNSNRGFITLQILLYTLAGAAVVILLLGVALKVQTSRLGSVQAEYATFQAKTKAEGETQEQRTRETIERHKRSADEAEKRSKRAVADIRAKYDGLRNASAYRGLVPPVPDTAPVLDAAARDNRLLSVLQFAEEQTRQLEELQGWVRAQQ